MDILEQDIQYLPGVGPSRKKILGDELGIHTYGDLLNYYPYKYVDRSRIYSVHELTGDMPFVQTVGRILSFETFQMATQGTGRRPLHRRHGHHGPRVVSGREIREGEL